MAQHGLYGRAVSADEVEVQVSRMGEYDTARLGTLRRVYTTIVRGSIRGQSRQPCCLCGTSRICWGGRDNSVR
jgi:hypothetical protein